MRFVPVAACEKIIKKAGADRASDKAKILLKEIIEDKASEIGKKATNYAKHAGRRTIKKEDIKLALE